MKGFTSRVLHAKFPKDDAYNALHMPIYEGVSYEFDSALEMNQVFCGEKFAHAYSRTSNPTVEYFEMKLKAATNAHAVLALASGMAAITSAILSIAENGDNIISSNHLFGHTYALFKNTFPQWGIEVRFADVSNSDELKKLIDTRTKLIFFESITNPQLEVVDIKTVADLAHAHNCLVMVDSTTTPPNVFEAASFGVDVEVMSTTKFISGGATVFGGAVIDHGLFDWRKNPTLNKWVAKFGKDAFISRMRKEIFRHLGGAMTPHTAHFMCLGIDLLDLRVEKCVTNTLKLAEFLEHHPKVASVNFPGLKSHLQYEISQLQFMGLPGAILALNLNSKEECFQFMDRLQMIRRSTNLNDNKTLIIHPFSTIYSEFTDSEKTQMGISDTLLRLSVGIEDIVDLCDDINQALQ